MIDDILLEAEDRMDKTVAATRDDFSSIRTGRATPGMFAKVLVDYYGAPTPVNQLASIQVPEPRMALLNPYDKSTLNAIERAVRDSDLGVNPGNDGNVIRCSFPQLTEDRRRDLVKVARTKAEDGKVSLRNIRRKAKDDLDKLGKDGDVGEDEVRRAEKDLDEVTSSHVNKVDAALKEKESELLEI